MAAGFRPRLTVATFSKPPMGYNSESSALPSLLPARRRLTAALVRGSVQRGLRQLHLPERGVRRADGAAGHGEARAARRGLRLRHRLLTAKSADRFSVAWSRQVTSLRDY